MADVNKDGVIEYDEFAAAAAEFLSAPGAVAAAATARTTVAAPPMPNLKDVPQDLLERYLKKLFELADTNGDGVLQPSEFKRMLEVSGFNFTRLQVGNLIAMADLNHDGVIEYDEFVPMAMELLQARGDKVADQVKTTEARYQAGVGANDKEGFEISSKGEFVVFTSSLDAGGDVRRKTDRVLSILKAHRCTDVEVVDLFTHPQLRDMMEETSGDRRTLPQIFINGKYLDGGVDELQYMHDYGSSK